MSKVKSLKEHAHEILKKNIGEAEVIVQNAQEQLEFQFNEAQDRIVEERLVKTLQKLEDLKKEIPTEERFFKALLLNQKLEEIYRLKAQKPEDRFGNKDFDENDPNLIIEDID